MCVVCMRVGPHCAIGVGPNAIAEVKQGELEKKSPNVVKNWTTGQVGLDHWQVGVHWLIRRGVLH